MADSRLDKLDTLLNTANTYPTAKCSLKSCKKLYHQEDLRERYCGNDCRVLSQKLQNKKSKLKKAKAVKRNGKIRLLKGRSIDFV